MRIVNIWGNIRHYCNGLWLSISRDDVRINIIVNYIMPLLVAASCMQVLWT